LPVSYDDVKATKQSLADDYRTRHEAFRKLRSYYHGNYWTESESEANSITSVFKDLVGARSDVGPDIKLVNNLLQQVVSKFQSFLSSSPMIRVYVDPPGSQTKRAQSNLKERYLYGTWAEGKMPALLHKAAWYLPLFGTSYLGAFPDLKHNCVRPILRSPEHAFPVPSFDGNGVDEIIFCWKARESAIKRQFPNYRTRAERRSRTAAMVGGAISSLLPKVGQSSDPEVEFWEFSGRNEWARWADGEKLNGVEHKFGFNLFNEMKFIDVPDEVWGHGAVEQIVNQVEMGNALQSLLFQAVIDNVFPSLVLIDPSKAPEEIDRGAGGVIPLNAGGDAKYLNAPINMQAGLGMLAENERQVKQGASTPDVSFGTMNASIITGKAINELQGAGTGSMVEMVQGNGIGGALVTFNEQAIYMGQSMFRDETIYLHGTRPGSMADLAPRQFAFSEKGSKLIGSGRNDVVFSPHLSQHEKVVMGLQMSSAGLVSKQWQREQVGIPDSAAMDEEIIGEAVQDAVIGTFLQGLATAADPAAVEQQAVDYVNAKPSQQIPAPPGLPPGAGPGGPTGAMPAPGMPPQIAAPGQPAGAAAMPPPPAGSPEGLPVEAPPAPGAGGGNIVTLDQAMTALLALQGVAGQVFLVGEIIETGQTDDAVEISVTDPADRQTIKSGVPFEVVFHVVQGEPQEEFLEATPGADPRSGGAEPDLAALGI
jgi:hypothetical protein